MVPAHAHTHPNEQWIYLMKGRGRVSVDGQPERIIGPGTLIYLPANIVHYLQALSEEDVLFLTCKDMSHGIIGMAAYGTMAGPYVDPGTDASKKWKLGTATNFHGEISGCPQFPQFPALKCSDSRLCERCAAGAGGPKNLQCALPGSDFQVVQRSWANREE